MKKYKKHKKLLADSLLSPQYLRPPREIQTSVSLCGNVPLQHQYSKEKDKPHIGVEKSNIDISSVSSPKNFRRENMIYEYGRVIATTQKMIKAAQILNIPILATTQSASKLGPTCPELELDTPSGHATAVHDDKTLFSMLTPSVQKVLSSLMTQQQGQTTTTNTSPTQPLSCVIVGIESHICVTQTTLDLLAQGHKVYVLADGVSSCNKEEVAIALARLRAEGAVVTTSESWIYECMGDAGIAEFRDVAKLVRECKEETSKSLEVLCKI
ncbi:hypothetical protein FKW77_007611 [Venturia effusa]|uniref:Isochorismatase-like domain-containing protein n=1 Tax=Venturia effusa TaxID=50376 RepID=A0A517LHM7_9PEZI|nr:hypothetical protein FKW77_007611 [Venturia effusa]